MALKANALTGKKRAVPQEDSSDDSDDSDDSDEGSSTARKMDFGESSLELSDNSPDLEDDE